MTLAMTLFGGVTDEQFHAMLITLGVFFAIGALGLWFVNKKKSAEDRKEAWRKYWLYLLIVWPLIFFYHAHAVTALFIFIFHVLLSAGAVIEVYQVTKHRKNIRWKAFLISGFILLVFLANDVWYDYTIGIYFFGVVIFDGFSQLMGQLLGGPKILPKISPKKSLGGLIGGTVITLVTLHLIFGTALAWYEKVGICAFAFVGDVLSSLLKRKCGVKDFNNLIPGHGGLLDRFDSFIVTAAGLLIIKLIDLFFLQS